MTTIIRQGDFIYSDSRYGSYYGGFPIVSDGPCKLYLAPNNKAVIGMAGAYSPAIPYDLITAMVDRAIEELQKYPNSNMMIAEELHEYYRKKRKEGEDTDDDDDTHDYQLLICTLKGTFIFNCIGDITMDFYHNRSTQFAIGSGAMYYTPFRSVDIPIEEKFKIIYESDNNSGGTVHAFNLNQLEVSA